MFDGWFFDVRFLNYWMLLLIQVVWHRKYDKMGVHVLTIGSETFISDLRIRPIKQHLMYNNHAQQSPIFYPVHSANSSGEVDSSQVGNANNNSPNNNHNAAINTNMDDYKLTWNLEIRRLRKDDTAFYYCVLNSENAYGQIYKLNVLCMWLIVQFQLKI